MFIGNDLMLLGNSYQIEACENQLWDRQTVAILCQNIEILEDVMKGSVAIGNQIHTPIATDMRSMGSLI